MGDTKQLKVVGQSGSLVGSMSKVRGETSYADDLFLPRMLYCRILRSTHPHALIRKIDTAPALKRKGVVAVITGKDLPIPYGILPVSQDEEALCVEKVRMVGDPVAAVAALDEETAEAALDDIQVEYEPLPSVMSVEEGLAETEAQIHEYADRGNIHKFVSLEFGEMEEGFAEADHIREDIFHYEGNTHMPMEQHAAMAKYGADGRVTLWSSTQTPHYVHRALAKVLELPASRIRVIACPVGGGFGGKTDPFPHEAVVCKLAMITGRPVKVTLTREEVFYCHRGRHPVLMWVRTGMKRDGSITAMHFRSYLDGGSYGSYGVASTYYTGALQTVTYPIANYKFEGLRVFTNKPPCGPKRGHGTPQPRFALEVQLDKFAEDLGLDPADLRLRHLMQPNTQAINHLHVTTMGLKQCIEKVSEAASFTKKYRGLPEGRGVGIASSAYLTGAGLPIYWNKMPHSGVQIKIDRGGGVDSLWLEFDKSSARLEATPPRFFLKIGNDLDSKGSAGDALDSYLPIINTITGMHWEDFVLGDMGEFWEGWPQGARIFQMGGSVEPVKNLLRVCIRDIPLSDASAFLESKGWASTGSNAHLFDDLSGLISRADLSIDLSDDGISRVGVECHTKDGWSDASRWDALLAYLREKGLLLHGKYEALRAFPGYTNDLTEKGAWVSTRVPQFVLLGYQRWLHHVKLSLSPVSVVSAKAYLAANLRGVSKESWVPLLNSQMAARRLELERRGSVV